MQFLNEFEFPPSMLETFYDSAVSDGNSETMEMKRRKGMIILHCMTEALCILREVLYDLRNTHDEDDNTKQRPTKNEHS